MYTHQKSHGRFTLTAVMFALSAAVSSLVDSTASAGDKEVPPALRPVAAAERRTTTSAGVRLRSSPSKTAQEVALLPLGTDLQVLEQSATREKIGGSEAPWYRVVTKEGKHGWVFGGFTAATAAVTAATDRRIAVEPAQSPQKAVAEPATPAAPQQLGLTAQGGERHVGNDYAKAAAIWRAALAANPRDPLAHYNLAAVAALQGDKPTARAELKWLATSTDPAARAWLAQAASDDDLKSIADEPDMRALLSAAHR